MNADEILNNTDPQELRNILKRLKIDQKAGTRPPPTIIVNQSPGQYPAPGNAVPVGGHDPNKIVITDDSGAITTDESLEYFPDSYAPGSQISTATVNGNNASGVQITGLTIGEWYAIEGTGGPWHAGSTPPLNGDYYDFALSLNGSSWSGSIGRSNASGRVELNLPTFCIYAEEVSTHYGRVYFKASTTSVWLRCNDVTFGDNSGTLGYKFLNAIVGDSRITLDDVEYTKAKLAGAIHTADEKTLLVDNDEFVIWDSATGGLKKVARNNIGAGLPGAYSEMDTSNPPTQAELISAFGDPSSFGSGTGVLNDSGQWLRVYAVCTDGVHYFVAPISGTENNTFSAAAASNASSPLTIPTYDGSGQCVHPSIYDAGPGRTWNGYRYWMAMTPYSGADNTKENPSIIVSEDGTTWSVPTGLTNPVIASPGTGQFNSDPDILVTPAGVMWMAYRKSTTGDEILVLSSSDGITWSSPATIVTAALNAILSPAWIWDGTQYVMWIVGMTASPNELIKRTCATPNGIWSSPTTCTLIGMPGGKELWHLDVNKCGEHYEGFFDLCDTETSGSNSVLYFATSPDGDTWTLEASALLSKTVSGWDNAAIYRASGSPTAGGYDLFYSAYNSSNVWKIGRTSVAVTRTGYGNDSLTRIIQNRNTKSNITAGAVAREEILLAYATDTQELGIYTNGAWLWIGNSSSSGSGGQVSGIARWGSGGGTAFELPDIAEAIQNVFDNGSLVDPLTYSLSADRTQIVFDSAVTAAHVVVADYIVAQV